MMPGVALGIVMIRSDTRNGVSTDGRSAGGRIPAATCGLVRRLAPERSAGTGSCAANWFRAGVVLNGRRDLSAPVGAGGQGPQPYNDDHGRDSRCPWGGIPDEPAGSRRGRNSAGTSQRRARQHVNRCRSTLRVYDSGRLCSLAAAGPRRRDREDSQPSACAGVSSGTGRGGGRPTRMTCSRPGPGHRRAHPA